MDCSKIQGGLPRPITLLQRSVGRRRGLGGQEHRPLLRSVLRGQSLGLRPQALPGPQVRPCIPILVGLPPTEPQDTTVPFKTNADRRHHIPKQRHQVTNWREYDEALRQRGSLTVWFTPAAIAAWRAEPRTTRGGQPHYSALAITTALTLRAVYRLALRQTEGLLGSIIRLLGLDLAVPDHSTLSRRAETLEVLRPQSSSEPMHLIVDSTGLKLCGPGEWLLEKHGTRTRRTWRKLHIGVDAETGEIVAIGLTDPDVDDGAQVGPLLDQSGRARDCHGRKPMGDSGNRRRC